MTDTKIDSAIKELPDGRYAQLADYALGGRFFWFLKLAVAACLILASFACLAVMRLVVIHYWPGSYAAAIVAGAIWISFLLFAVRRVTSLEFSSWLLDVAIKHEFKRGHWGAP